MKTTMHHLKIAPQGLGKHSSRIMKCLMFVLLNIMFVAANAQSPNALPYQAVARNASGGLIAGQAISLRFSIHDLTAAGAVVYKETQTVTTNNLGLFSVNIGSGTPITGTLSGVNWSSGAKFIQVEMDVTGGTTYTDMGTTQLMSVPYALYAAKAGNLPNGTLSGNTLRWNGTAWVDNSLIFNSGTNVGIGNTSPSAKLDVTGMTKTTNFQMTNGGGAGKVLLSDATGNATWTDPNTISINESDPQVSSVSSNKIPKWNGTTLTDGIITDNGTNVGVGTTTPGSKLEVAGNTKTTNLQMTTGAGAGKVLQSDATGNASWVNSTSLSITELDPQVGTLSTNRVPKWNGATLNDGAMYDNGTNVGIGTTSPTLPLTVRSTTVDTFENVASLANANSDQGFQLNTTRGDVTNTSGSIMTQIGQAYNGNPPTEAIRFHRGTGSTNGSISITTSNTERMRITNAGNVGIGTTTPRGTLDVQRTGNIYLSDSTDGGSTRVAYMPGNLILAPNSTSNVSFITARRETTTGSNNELQLRTMNNGTVINALRIDSLGDVGIGVTTPVNKLDVEGALAVGATYSGSNTAPVNGAIIEGNVGIGTNTPVNKLDVEGGLAVGVNYSGTNVAPANGAIIQGRLGISTPAPRAAVDLGASLNNRKIVIYADSAKDNSHQFNGFGITGATGARNLRYQVDSTAANHVFYSAADELSSNELMRITGTGNVGIGTSTPTQKLDVAGTVKTTAFQMPTGAANNYVLKSDASGNASWANLTSITLTENDPQVSSATTNQIPKWNGTTLIDGIVTDNGTNVGIGTTTPTSRLDVSGTVKATGFQLPTGAANNFVLKSDASGNASWTNLNSIIVTETDPKVGTLSTNKMPKWNGTTLADGQVTDNGTNVGIGTAAPTSKLHIKSTSNNSVPFTIEKSSSANPVFTVTQGAGAGNGYVGVYDYSGVEGVRLHSINDSWFLGNLGVGTTAPRGVFDVQTHGNIYLSDSTNSGSNQRLFAPGQVTLAPYNGTDVSYIESRREDNTGNSELQFRTVNNGVLGATMRLTNDGKVGIGTTTPSNKLDVNGTIRTNDIIISSGAGNGKILTSDANGNAFWQSPSASETDPQVGALNTNDVPRWNGSALSTGSITDDGTNVDIDGKLAVGTSTNTNGLDIKSNVAIGNAYAGTTTIAPTNGAIIQGNVGIGTSSPANKLDVYGGLAVGATNAGVNTAPANGAIIQGSVGIGTSSPTTKLEVLGTTKTNSLRVTTGAVPGHFLRALDAAGNAEWAAPAALINEQDPEVTCLNTYHIPYWAGNTLTDGSMTEMQGGKISVGFNGTPGGQFTVTKNGSSTDIANFVTDDINHYADIGIGRNHNVEGRIGIAASNGQFFNNAQAGDMIFRAENSSNRLLFGSNPTQDAELSVWNGIVDVSNNLSTRGNLTVGYGSSPIPWITPFSALDVYTGWKNAWIHGNGNGNQYSPQGYPLLVNGGQNGIAVQVTNIFPDQTNNFMTFFGNNGNARGTIEGQSYFDLQNNWEYVWFYTHHALAAATAAASLVCSTVGAVLVDPGWICQGIVGLAEIADEVADWVLYAQDMEQNYGITYKSGGADYAEWMPRTRLLETLTAGDIVGVKDGHISKSTADADQLMVISTAPMVLGNVPEKNKEHEYNKVAFMGQVPVKVNGMVKSGDFILSSGYDDGYGYAKSEENMTAADFKHIVGIAWAAKKTEGIGFVNTAVGINSNKLSGRMSKMQEENEALKNQVESIASYLKAKDPSFNLGLPAATKPVEVKNVKANPEQDMANAQIGFVNLIGEIKADPEKYTPFFKAVKAELIKRGYNLDKVPEIRDMLSDANAYVKGLEKYQNLMNKHMAVMQSNQPDHK